MKIRERYALAFVILLGMLGLTSPAICQTTFIALHPGQLQQIAQNLQINIVFVGYHQGSGPRDINEARFREGLPQSYASVNRYPELYGLSSPTGLKFRYNCNLVFSNSAFEDVPIEPEASPADSKSKGKNSLFRDSTDSWRRFGLM